MLASFRSELLRFRTTARTGAIAMSALVALVTVFAFTGVEPSPEGSRPVPGGAADASRIRRIRPAGETGATPRCSANRSTSCCSTAAGGSTCRPGR